MTRRSQTVFVLALAALGALATSGPVGLVTSVRAQDSDRSRDDGESREERRERFRRGFFGGDRGGDSGRGSRDDDERRGDEGSGRGSSSTPSTGGSSSSTPSSSSSASMNMSDYAKSLVKQHDKNGNMMLEGDERKELRGRAADSDINKDNVITVDELVAKLSGGAPAAPSATSSSTSSSGNSSGSSESSGDRDRDRGRDGDGDRDGDRDRGRSSRYDSRRRDGDSSNSDRSNGELDAAKRVLFGSAGGSTASTKEGDKRRSYRFRRAAERLPQGLPSFFSRDKNGNGQVEMSEYSQSWSKNSVAEFQRLDLDSDGVITAKEAAKKP